MNEAISRWSRLNKKYCVICDKLLYRGSTSGRCSAHRVISEETRKKMGLSHKGERNVMKKPEIALKLSGINHYLWKGDKVSYRGLHTWIERRLGRPKACEHCGKTSENRREIQWANKSHKYLRKENDWIALCVPCHKKYDK